MSDCSVDHTIDLRNLDDECLFTRKVVQICGTLSSTCSQKYVEIKKSNSDHIQKVLIFNKNFKYLMRFEEESEISINIKYCQKEKVIKLNHKTNDPIYYDVEPIYIIPKNHNGKFQSNIDDENNSIEKAHEKINLSMELAQCVLSSKIFEAENVERSFALRKCENFYSSIEVNDVREMNQWDLYDKIAEEIIQVYGVEMINKRKFVAFVSCTRFLGLNENDEYNYENIKSKTQANPSLGSGFLALLGSGCFYSLPNHFEEVIDAFKNKEKVDLKHLLDDSNYRRTYGGCFSTYLGSLIHEIGHMFDLGHTTTGLMGNDIDFVHRFFMSENFTEIMPKRNVANCQQEAKVEQNHHVNRFTKIKKNGAYLEKYREQKNNDMTFFERNCIITLANNRWFTQITADGIINMIERTIFSNQQIMLVEIRELNYKNSLLKTFWDISKSNETEFKIPDDILLENVCVFVITKFGCVLKKDVIA